MNLTSQYIVNPKNRDVYIEILANYKSIRTTSTRLRLNDDRQVLNLKDLKEKDEFRVGKVKFKMIRCPIGQFKMGEDAMLTSIKRPFLLGETEVTQELFKAVMGYNPSEFKMGGYRIQKQRPVENVTWYDALMFCNKLSEKLGKRPYYNITNTVYTNGRPNIESANITINPQPNGFRLPYEKEWEYAAKAGTNNQWAGTDNVDTVKEVAWFEDNSNVNGNLQTHPVKGKQPNEWGFYDMSGNVLEWCWDKYYPYSSRVNRGGCFGSDTSYLQSTFQAANLPGSRSNKLGFRIASSLGN